MSLEMRPDCERCGTGLPPEGELARISSMECTFCAACADGPLGGRCPNCGGVLERRPSRAASLMAKYPASETRRFRG